MTDRKNRPNRWATSSRHSLGRAGLGARVEQAASRSRVAALVGAADRGGDEPHSISANGTLFVHVTTNAWMNELSLLEPELLRQLNAVPGRPPIARLRMLLKR